MNLLGMAKIQFVDDISDESSVFSPRGGFYSGKSGVIGISAEAYSAGMDMSSKAKVARRPTYVYGLHSMGATAYRKMSRKAPRQVIDAELREVADKETCREASRAKRTHSKALAKEKIVVESIGSISLICVLFSAGAFVASFASGSWSHGTVSIFGFLFSSSVAVASLLANRSV